MINYNFLRDRKEIIKHTKYKNSEKSSIVNIKKEELYKFYICDYCGDEIIIKKKKYEMSGGICILPQSLTKKQPVKAILCNKCLKNTIKEMEE